jgi:sulfoxide reductase heme-binding subunit YedZ
MSAVAVLGILRSAMPKVNPFLVEGLHINAALLTIAFGGLHILASILDPYARLGPLDALVPFVSAYRGTWLGLGVISGYVYGFAIVTSWPMRRLPRPLWLWLHRTMYAAWVLALMHALATGSDTRNELFLFLNILAVAGVLAAFIGLRVTEGWPASPALWGAVAGLALLVILGVGVWAVDGPLQPGWARASGTPPDLLHPSP